MREQSYFPDDHYTRDWELLKAVGDEWEPVRRRLGLGSRATREQIERVWDDVFPNEVSRPNMRRLHHELFRDGRLFGHLRKCFWQELKPPERKGYTFDRVQPVVLMRIFWLQVKTAAETYKNYHSKLEHWARWWNTQTLTEELRRAINDLDSGEDVRGIQSPRPRQPDEDDSAAANWNEPETDYRNRRVTGPESMAMFYEAACHALSEREARAYKDFDANCGECTPKEEQTIAARHGMTREQLNAVIRRVISHKRGN